MKERLQPAPYFHRLLVRAVMMTAVSPSAHVIIVTADDRSFVPHWCNRPFVELLGPGLLITPRGRRQRQ